MMRIHNQRLNLLKNKQNKMMEKLKIYWNK